MIKKIFTLLVIVFVTAVAFAKGGAEIKFNTTVHDFGSIKAAKGEVSYAYKFTNTGDAPLVIVSVTNGGCGCTRPEYPKQPIAPGKTGVITIKFNPTGRRGEFNRQVQVKTNAAKGKRVKLKFSGSIIP